MSEVRRADGWGLGLLHLNLGARCDAQARGVDVGHFGEAQVVWVVRSASVAAYPNLVSPGAELPLYEGVRALSAVVVTDELSARGANNQGRVLCRRRHDLEHAVSALCHKDVVWLLRDETAAMSACDL